VSLSERSMSVPAGWRAAAAIISMKRDPEQIRFVAEFS
jgi:hypothetical protein